MKIYPLRVVLRDLNKRRQSLFLDYAIQKHENNSMEGSRGVGVCIDKSSPNARDGFRCEARLAVNMGWSSKYLFCTTDSS